MDVAVTHAIAVSGIAEKEAHGVNAYRIWCWLGILVIIAMAFGSP